MSGYAASAHIVRASPRVVAHGRGERPTEAFAPRLGAVVEEAEPETRDAVSLGERWSRFHDRWAQLTFFLTDPNSWR